MQLHKISATSSTNTYLKEMLKNMQHEGDIVVVTDNQTNGRGQLQNKWQSRQGQSLTFSVFKPELKLNIEKQFFISMAASLAVKKTVSDMGLHNVSIKWPNDILSANKKFCGILVENLIRHAIINGSIIGIGINVNEISFDNLPRATSMKLESGNSFNLDEIMYSLLHNLEFYLRYIIESRFDELKHFYLAALYRKDLVSCFQTKANIFNGIIRGVTPSGKLIVEHDDSTYVEYDLKEISLLY